MTKQWVLDKENSQIRFMVKHMMITTVVGGFSEFEGRVETEGNDFSKAIIHFSAKTASVFTGNAGRDTHVKSADFFDVEKFPELKFESHHVEKQDERHFRLRGNMTIKDVTKEIEAEAEWNGFIKDPWGKEIAGFNITGIINRKDFGLKWNVITEAGHILVGEEARISCEVELIALP
jgi:polyisoprenoid-binding protein YceI